MPTIGFTYDLKSDHAPDSSAPQDALAEFDREETIDEVVAAIECGGYKVVRIGNVHNLLKRLPDLGVDIVFNICEGVGGRNRESEVPVILDLYNIPYVGSDGLTLSLTLDKVMAKKVFTSDGILTPKYFVADGVRERALRGMSFPLIVKPLCEGSSKGISQDSIVKDKRSLWRQVKEVLRLYRQPALVEEFIHGGEFTVLVIGNDVPLALPPVQISIAGNLVAGDQVYTSRRLSNDEIVYVCPPKISKSLDKKLRDAAVDAYKAVGCRDFGRVDFRTDKKGTPYVLEINPLPSLSTEDVFPLTASAHGWSFEKLLSEIIKIGLERYGLN
jgi:D-alanine-D-alanine ligase